MTMESSIYLGFTDDASRHTRNMASSAWVIYSPEGQLMSSGGVHLDPSTNNVAEYSAIIELLQDAISYGFQSLEVRLDS
jgi:ribonuclease HI